jgi:hypothetical protein
MKQLGGCCFILVLLFIILCLSSASGCPTCACRAAGTRLVQGSGDARGSEQKGRRRGNSVTSTRTTYAVATMCPPCSCPEPAKLASNRNRRSTHPAPDTASSAGSKLSLYTIEMTFEMALSKVFLPHDLQYFHVLPHPACPDRAAPVELSSARRCNARPAILYAEPTNTIHRSCLNRKRMIFGLLRFLRGISRQG